MLSQASNQDRDSERIKKVNNPDNLVEKPSKPSPGAIVDGKKKVIELDGPPLTLNQDKNVIILPAAVPQRSTQVLEVKTLG